MRDSVTLLRLYSTNSSETYVRSRARRSGNCRQDGAAYMSYGAKPAPKGRNECLYVGGIHNLRPETVAAARFKRTK